MKKLFILLAFIALGFPHLLKAQNISTFAGNGITGFSGDGGPATSGKLNDPTRARLDRVGNLYIADYNNNRVRKVDTNGIITTIAGNGSNLHTGDGGPASASQLAGPTSVVVDSIGNIYISEGNAYQFVRKINTSGIITTIAGNGTTTFSGDGGPATAAGFVHISDIEIDANGNIFIIDASGYRLRKINTAGIITTIMGNGIAGFTGDGGPGTAAKLNLPVGVAVDRHGNIFIADAFNYRIRKLDTNGIASTIAGTGSPFTSGDGGPATIANLTCNGVAVDAVGNVYIATGDKVVRKVNQFGIISTVAGNGINGYSGDGGPATLASLNQPYGVSVDSHGNFYICDDVPSVIRKVTVASTLCIGSTITLTDASSGGIWSSSNTSIATVGSSTGVVTGVAAGIANISYTTGSGSAMTTITVNPTPSAISGTASLCLGNCVTYTDAVPGGSWSSSSPSIATAGSATGIVCGVALGNTSISYTMSNGCYAVLRATVNSLPASFTVTGGGSYCAGGGGLHIGLSGSSLGVNYQLMLGASAVGSPLAGTGGSIDFGLLSPSGTYTVVATNATTGCTRTMIGSATITINPLPSPIVGPTGYCIGGTGTLSSTPAGGSWSGGGAVVTIGSSSGLVTALSTGTGNITYTASTGCFISTQVTVNPSVGTTSGPASVCIGATISLSNTTPGGVWTSSAPSIAGIGSLTGIVTGMSVGTSVITYSLGSTCTTTSTVNVTSGLSPITGPSNACIGSTVSLSDAMPGGTWTSSNTTVATVSGTGVVTGAAIGVTTISYTISGCSATLNVSVNASPSPISGPSSVCVGSNITMTNSVSGGVWSTTSSTISIGSATGAVTGLSAGAAFITYSIATCVATTVITVNPSAPIAGTFAVCVGGTTVLTDAATGGTWSSTNTSVASIVAGSGLLTAVAPGTSVITYSLPSGCTAIATVTINAAPGPISGPSSLCDGTSITLTNATPGGTWTSGTTSVLIIGSSTGIITTTGPGTSTITYDVGGCFSTYPVTVTPAPAAISGPSSACMGLTATLTNSVPGGVWSSSNSAVATIGSSSGIATGIASGTVLIFYTIGTSGCSAITALIVNPIAPIIGTPSVCVGQTTNLDDTVLGGSWSSSNPSVGSINTAGVVTGIAPGVTTITYTLPTGCSSTIAVTVNAVPAAITGTPFVCMGQFTTLHDATAGGTWTSSDPSVATVSGTGDVTGVFAGTAIISYTVSTGCSSVVTFTVNPAPPGIVGPSTICMGTCDNLSDALTGGTWTSSSISTISVGSSSGVACGVAVGTAIITYHAPVTGCVAIQSITVLPLPSAITGPPSLCVGSSVFFSDPAPGGTWSSSNTSIASVGPTTGFVTGNSNGIVNISYTVSSGCSAVKVLTVNPLPSAIAGITNVCIGLTTHLTDAAPGGFWTSSDVSVATVGVTSGTVTGIAAGTAVITYTIPTGCAATVLVHVGSGLAPITGTPAVCVGTTSTLADASPGGTWTSSSPAIASVSPTGVLTGVALGTAIISYSDGSPCPAVLSVTVNPAPLPIVGSSNICIGTTTFLTDPVPGGTWTSSDISVATINPVTGALVGVAAGSATITYTMGSGCDAFLSVTVQLLPSPITGPTTLCVAQTITLSDATFGGTWSSSTPSVATVGSLTGIVTGIGSGVAVINYSNGVGCSASYSVTVLPTPTAITGSANMCLGGSTTLFNSVSGGIWTSSNTAIATIGSLTGIVSGVTAGYATITYQILPGGCSESTTVNVIPLPTAYTVTGGGSYCASDTGVHIGLSNSDVGVNYTLYHGATAIGTLPGTGAALDYGLLTSPGTYSIKGTNTTTTCQNTMTGSAFVTIIPNVTPSVLVSPSPNDTVCTGAAVVFTPTPVNGGSTPVYQWFVNGVLIGVYSTYSYIPANGDIVKVIMTSNATCALPATAADSLPMTVLSYGTPVVTTYSTPGDTVCLGSSVTVHSVPVYGGSAPVYFWLLNGTNVASTPSYSFIPSDGDQIYCVMYSSYPCRLTNRDTSDVTTMAVDTPVAPVVTIGALPGSTIGHGQEDTLTANVTGAVAPTYQWYINGVLVPGATNSTYISSSFSYPTADSVSCEVTSHDICVTSAHSWIFITVNTEGVSQLNSAGDVRITPNPNSGDFTIAGSVNNTIGNGISIELTNMLGRTVYSSIAKLQNGKLNEQIHLDVSIANGIYLLTLRSGSESKMFHVAVTR